MEDVVILDIAERATEHGARCACQAANWAVSRGTHEEALDLLLRCARVNLGEDVSDLEARLQRHPDWERLIALALRHGLLPLLHLTLSGTVSRLVPAEILGRLRAMAERNRFHGLFLTSELLRVLGILKREGVAAIPFKGPALAAAVYGDYALRHYVDIDLLVPPSQALAARRALVEAGHRLDRDVSPGLRSAYVALHKDFVFRGDARYVIDVIWRIAPWYFRLPEIPAVAWSRLGRVSLAGVDVPCLAPEDLLFVLALHGCKHRWEALKWIVDIAELVRTHADLDWRAVGAHATRCGAERMVALGLVLASELLDVHLPPGALDVIQRAPGIAALAADVRGSLFDEDAESVDTLAALRFLAKVGDRFDTKVFCRLLLLPYFLLHRVIRPGVTALRARAGRGVIARAS